MPFTTVRHSSLSASVAEQKLQKLQSRLCSKGNCTTMSCRMVIGNPNKSLG